MGRAYPSRVYNSDKRLTYTTNQVAFYIGNRGITQNVQATKTTVSKWANQAKTGSKYDLGQATASKQPLINAQFLNGISGVTFDGINDVLDMLDSAGLDMFQNLSAYTVYAVVRLEKSQGYGRIFQATCNGSTQSRVACEVTGTNRISLTTSRADSGGDGEWQAQAPINSYTPYEDCILSWTVDYTGSRVVTIRKNGVTIKTQSGWQSAGNTANTPSATIKMGNSGSGTSMFDGTVFALAVYHENTLTTGGDTQIMADLNAMFPALGNYQSPVVTNPENWELTFSDDFTAAGLDTAKWNTYYEDGRHTTPSNAEQQYYLDANVVVSGDGTCQLVGKREDTVQGGTTYHYTSGMIASWQKFEQQYGYFEIRCSLPAGPGTWPAFWLLRSNQTPKYLAGDHTYWEIDLFENYGADNTALFANSFIGDAADKRQNIFYNGSSICDNATMHKIAVDWQADYVDFYFDDVRFGRITEKAYIPNMPMYILANLAIGGVSDPTSRAFPCSMVIDHIKVWQRKTLAGT